MTNNRLTSAQRYGRQQESLLAALPFILCTNKLRFVITAYGQLHQKRTSLVRVSVTTVLEPYQIRSISGSVVNGHPGRWDDNRGRRSCESCDSTMAAGFLYSHVAQGLTSL